MLYHMEESRHTQNIEISKVVGEMKKRVLYFTGKSKWIFLPTQYYILCINIYIEIYLLRVLLFVSVLLTAWKGVRWTCKFVFSWCRTTEKSICQGVLFPFPFQFQGKAFVLSSWLLRILLTPDRSPFLRLPLLIQHEDKTLMNWCVQSVFVTLYKLGYHLLIHSSLWSKVPMLPLLPPFLVNQRGPGKRAWGPWKIC